MIGLGWLRSRLTESRAANDYTDLLLTQQLAAAKGYGSVRASAGYRSCLNLIDDAAAAADLTGDHSEILQPRLGAIARALVDRGSSAFEMLIGADGRLSLLPVEVTGVVGSAEEASWIYTLTRTGPSVTSTVAREQAGVLNFRARPETRTPWRGQPALESSSTTGAVLAQLEDQMEREARVLPTRIITGGGVVEQAGDIEQSVARGGIVTLVQGQVIGRDDPSGVRAGAIKNESTQAVVSLHEDLTRLICGVCGVPSNLVLGSGDGGAAREAFRRFAATTIASSLKAIQTEWQSKVGPLSYSLDGLRASDETARARAVGSRATAVQKLVSSGLPLNQALALAGVD